MRSFNGWMVKQGTFMTIFPLQPNGEVQFSNLHSIESTEDIYLEPQDHYVPPSKIITKWTTADSKYYIRCVEDDKMVFFRISNEWCIALLKKYLEEIHY